MELPQYLLDLWRSKLLVLVASVIAVLTGGFVAYQPTGSGVAPRYVSTSAESSVVLLLSSPRQPIVATEVQVPRGDQYFRQDLPTLAGVYSYLVVGAIRDEVSTQVGTLRPGIDSLSAVRRSTQPAQSESDSQMAGKQNLPLLEISARSSSTARAVLIRDAAVAALRAQIEIGQDTANTPLSDRVALTEVGSEQIRSVSSPASRVALTIGVLVFLLLCILIILVASIRRIRPTKKADALDKRRSPDAV